MRLYSTQDVARELGLGRSTVNKYALEHELGRKMGLGRIFTQEDVDKLRRIIAAAPPAHRPATKQKPPD